MKTSSTAVCLILTCLLGSCEMVDHQVSEQLSGANILVYKTSVTPGYRKFARDVVIDRAAYRDKLHGFWLGQSIANWTGLITEMDKVTAPFYTDEDWGAPDQMAIWGEYVPHADFIDFYFVEKGEPWGADDDTDIEYMYQHLLDQHSTSMLSAEQIRAGWLTHIYSEHDAPLYKKFSYSEPVIENFLWVSNERARILMEQGMLPPATSEPKNNDKHMMIDAQLTTEIFGLFAPGRPDIALRMAQLPIRVSAKFDAEWAAQFYVVMYSLATLVDSEQPLQQQIHWLSEQAREYLPAGSVVADMYDFILQDYLANPNKSDWEQTRDAVYQRYQIAGHANYDYREPFDAAINFAASLISLFYGQGDLVKTIKIGSLAGWDSDNPTATWGGLYGFILGNEKIMQLFAQDNLSDTYWIHRTRRNFPDRTSTQAGEDSFPMMAERGIYIIDRVVQEEMRGAVDLSANQWLIPAQN